MNVGKIAMAVNGNAALASKADGGGTGQRVIAIAWAVAAGDAGDFSGDQVRQIGPLSRRELIGADQANTDALLVVTLGMGADLIEVAAGHYQTGAVDDVVVTDGLEASILPAAPFIGALESALGMPLVDDLGRVLKVGGTGLAAKQGIRVRAGGAVDDDEVDWSHAPTLRRRATGVA